MERVSKSPKKKNKAFIVFEIIISLILLGFTGYVIYLLLTLNSSMSNSVLVSTNIVSSIKFCIDSFMVKDHFIYIGGFNVCGNGIW